MTKIDTVTEVKVETIDAFDLKVQDFPWLTADKLDYSISVRGNTSGILAFTKLASGWTWVVDFTWFWFTPSSYVINAWLWNNATVDCWTSLSTYIDWTTFWQYIQDSSWSSQVQDLGSRMIAIYNTSWSKTRADHSKFITDWIELNFVDSDLDVKFIVTAYK